jgi:serine/threonine-protein phosphatase 2B catalytic subunit
VKSWPPPPAQLLTAENLYNDKNMPDIKVLTDHLNGEGVLAQELLLDLVKRAADLFEAEPNLLKLNDPITVVGDIHGQYFDLVKLLEVGGAPGDTQYIFLGDYVDRGSFSLEVIATMFAFKINYPKRVRMLRGNHECRQMTSFFNFREECEYKYDITVYNTIMDAFDTLPLAATVNGQFLCVHGGISPELPTLKAINTVNRMMEPPREGLFCDLIWSDPLESQSGQEKGAKSRKGNPPFVPNEARGCSYFYSFEGAAKFLKKNSLLSIIRAHEAQLEGYKMHQTNPNTSFPSVITIFSAPNYCDCYNNKAAILKFDNSSLNILQFNCSPHPYHLPNFMDVFAWSMPFVIEKVTEMLYFILQPPGGGRSDDDDEIPELPAAVKSTYRSSLTEDQNNAVDLASKLAAASKDPKHPEAESDESRRAGVRKKVRSVARMARMFKTMRQENETVIRLGGMTPGDKLSAGLLLAAKDRIQSDSEMFGHVQAMDFGNEARPTAPGDEGITKSSPSLPPGARDFADDG